MSNETKTPNTRITYLDGHTDEVCVTMWQRCQAETHAKAKGWGSALDAVVKLNAYAAYVRCRQLGSTTWFPWWTRTTTPPTLKPPRPTAATCFSTRPRQVTTRRIF